MRPQLPLWAHTKTNRSQHYHTSQTKVTRHPRQPHELQTKPSGHSRQQHHKPKAKVAC